MGALKEKYINNIPSDEDLEEYYIDYKSKYEGRKDEKNVRGVCSKVYDSGSDMPICW